MFHEETARIVGYYVEQECNSHFQSNHVQDWQSRFQSTAVPIPKPMSTDSRSVTVIGQLAHEILRITDPKYWIIIRFIGRLIFNILVLGWRFSFHLATLGTTKKANQKWRTCSYFPIWRVLWVHPDWLDWIRSSHSWRQLSWLWDLEATYMFLLLNDFLFDRICSTSCTRKCSATRICWNHSLSSTI